jgi:single-strand DNA-binding protein
MLNRVLLIGRLTRDPELRTTGTGRSVVDFSIAVDKRTKPADGSPTADFFRVSCWDKTAEYCNSYLHKGRLCYVEGSLNSRKYTAGTGETRESIEVLAERVHGMERILEETTAQPALVSET